MAYKEVRVENVRWYPDEISYTGMRVLGFCRQGLGFLGDEHRLVAFARENMLPAIKMRRSKPVVLMNRGYDLEFSWPAPSEVEDESGLVTVKEEEPRLTFYDRSLYELMPSQRDQLFRTVDQIVEEAASVYKLDVRRVGAVELRFPKKEYGTVLGVERALMLR